MESGSLERPSRVSGRRKTEVAPGARLLNRRGTWNVRLKHLILFCGFVLQQPAGCTNASSIQDDAGTSEAVKSAVLPEADRARQPAASPNVAANQQLSDPLRGKVKETLGAGGYTYILLATEQGEIWAAASRFAVAPGDEVEIAALSSMRNFRSPTLGRVFEEIQFAGLVKVIDGSATAEPAHTQAPTRDLPPGHPPLRGEVAAQPKPDQPSRTKAGQIERLADGVTVAELFANKAELAGTVVRLRGQVVKASRKILGSNWLHIQDGSGEPGKNDITVTAKNDFATVGSIVVIEGTVGVDKDFGAGYSYDVIVEDAKILLDTLKPDRTELGSGK